MSSRPAGERLRLGSLELEVRTPRRRHLEMLRELVRVQPADAARSQPRREIRLRIREEALSLCELEERNRQPLIRRAESPGTVPEIEIRRDLARAVLRRPEHHRLDVELHLAALRDAPEGSAEPLEARVLHALMIVLYRALLELGCVLLHGAAVLHRRGAVAFLGDKGAGKTTLSLHLGRCGYPVLAEDHVLVARTLDPSAEAGFEVSGCDHHLRLTARTERHYFDQPLDLQPVNVAGTPKKEISPVVAALPWRPFEDVPLRRICFVRVGASFGLEPIHTRAAVVEILAPLRERFRLHGREDRQLFLDYFVDLAESVDLHRVTLSRDLRELDRLAEWLETR